MSPVKSAFVLLLVVLGQTQCEEVEEVVRIVTDNLAHYQADITYTIEHFLELPLSDQGYFSYETPKIPSQSPRGIQWSFVILPASLRHGSKDFGLILNLKALPENTKSFEVTTECSIVGKNGQRQKTQNGKETFTEARGSFVYVDFAARSELENEANQLLRNGHLTINCKIEGMIVPKTNEHELIPTVEVESKSRSNVTVWSPSNCSGSIADDTLQRLTAYDFELERDAVLIAPGERIEVHKDILSARSPVFKEYLAKSSYIDFRNDLGDSELKDLISFLYEGKAPGLRNSCYKLYEIAKKYQVTCLSDACEVVLIQGLDRDTARQTLDLAIKNGDVELARKTASFISKSN